MSYSADFTLSTNAAFIGLIQMSMVNNALQIASERPTAFPIVDSKRNTLAVGVLNNSSLYLTRFVLAAIESNGETTLTASSTDVQIDSAITSVWNDIAGVTTRDQSPN
jgi:hypothetical protein